jgi:hypothetical protein
MLYMRVFRSGKERIVAACDSELLGRSFGDGEATLDLDKYAGFYRGELVGAERVAEELASATSANLVGERAVAAACAAKIARKADALRIAGVPHLQVYRIKV